MWCCAAAAEPANATTEEAGAAANGTVADNTATNSTKTPKMKKIKVPQQVRVPTPIFKNSLGAGESGLLSGAVMSVQVLRPRVVGLEVKAEHFGVHGMNEDEMKESAELLNKFFQLEQEKKLLEMAKNQLESYIINTRSALSEDNVQQVNPLSSSIRHFPSSSMLIRFAQLHTRCEPSGGCGLRIGSCANVVGVEWNGR